MALNRRQRRARNDRRPHADDSPAQQMKAFLKAPGKLHIVQLPDDKSFVVKVTEREMPLFLTICGQLRAVLGHCEAIPATPVEASVADANDIARQTANDPGRLADAQRRQNEAELARAAAADASAAMGADVDELEASMRRHPAGNRRPAGGRHAKPEPDTVFDMLAGAGNAFQDDDEATARIAAIELAAAQDAAARAQEAADAANARLAEVYERTGEIHNQRVLNRFTDAAGQAIAEQVENDGLTPHDPKWEVTGPGTFTIDTDPDRTGRYSAPELFAPDADDAIVDHRIRCARTGCHWATVTSEIAEAASEYANHLAQHVHDDINARQIAENERCSCPRSIADDSRTGTHPRCEVHGPDRDKPLRVITDNPQA